MSDPGKRDRLISLTRATTTTNDYGEDIPGEAVEITKAWALIRWGTGQERREAAQESASQSATFVCDRNPTLDGVLLTDRISYQNAAWDITGIAPVSRSDIEITATRGA